MKKKILLLEDELDSMDCGLDTTKYDVDLVRDLETFDFCLYDDPGIDFYNAVVMDLKVVLGEWAEDRLEEVLPVLAQNRPIKAAGIELHGLTYLRYKLLADKKMRSVVQQKFILISGHAGFITRENVFENNEIDFPHKQLLDKGDEFYFDNLRAFIK